MFQLWKFIPLQILNENRSNFAGVFWKMFPTSCSNVILIEWLILELSAFLFPISVNYQVTIDFQNLRSSLQFIFRLESELIEDCNHNLLQNLWFRYHVSLVSKEQTHKREPNELEKSRTEKSSQKNHTSPKPFFFFCIKSIKMRKDFDAVLL